MFVCILDGERICSLDLSNKYGIRDYDLARKWKEAQKQKKLICEDCNCPVELRVGTERNPYFAHAEGFTNRDCYYEKTETEEHRKAKEVLYQYCKSNFTGAKVQMSQRLGNNRIADIYIAQNNKELAIEFVRSIQMPDWEEKNNSYKEIGVPVLWFLTIHIFERKGLNLKLHQEIVLHETDGVVKFLNIENGMIKLVREISYHDKDNILKHNELFSMDLKLDSIQFQLNGSIRNSCFEESYRQEKDRLFAKWKKQEEEEEAHRARIKSIEIGTTNTSQQFSSHSFKPKLYQPKESSVIPQNQWEVIARRGGVHKCIELLEQCKSSELLFRERKESYEAAMRTINSCYTIVEKHNKNQLAPNDLDRLYLRVGNLAARYIKA